MIWIIAWLAGGAGVGLVWRARGHGLWRGVAVGLACNLVTMVVCMFALSEGDLAWASGVFSGSLAGCAISLARRSARAPEVKQALATEPTEEYPRTAESISPEAPVYHHWEQALPLPGDPEGDAATGDAIPLGPPA